jgi:hypothetical protein
MIRFTALWAGVLLVTSGSLAAEQPGIPKVASPEGAGQPDSGQSRPASVCEPSTLGSPYIPVDSWIYPAVLRLYSLGFVNDVYLGMRPWTRASVSHMLEEAGASFQDADPDDTGAATNEARDIYKALNRELHFDTQSPCGKHEGNSRAESVYTMARAISGTPLRDSYHLGSTIVNDYGRPYENGFNSYSGASGYASAGRFVLYARGEFQGAPSATGYSATLAGTLAAIDGTTNYFNPTCWSNSQSPLCTPIPYNQQATIPAGPIAAATNGRVVEAYASVQYLNHVISFGKQDEWLGPGQGGAFAYSNNAENIYVFQINRIEPLHIPLLSKLTGPFRYEFLIGPLKGHIYPIDSWVHIEKISMRPTENFEVGFERTVIWGGKGHEPITLHTFLKSFFSLTAPNGTIKDSRDDPGARFGAADFSYRLPFVRNWLTLYADAEAHDDVSPVDAPRHADFRPGLYLSHTPGIPKLDVRAEAVYTDPPTGHFTGGTHEYYETIQRQGYTNNGQIFGDWIGREGKGGQGWITYHLSGNEWIQAGVRRQKVAKDFIPGGTTLSDINFQAVKRVGKDFEINGSFAYERWKAPIYLPGQQTVTTTTIQLTWFPQRKVSF